ncbi:MAG: phytanoyl-CoA dioxygenase family protein, partial [Rhodoferax sp.]|nr:phytanoyl-CoA dioxygenase family protein [Rhodoferax sp.]
QRFDGETGTPMPVHAGEMSLHHTDLVHASGANDSDDRRIGYAISYIPAHVRPVGPIRPSALLVRGRNHGHFVPEQRLDAPLSDAAVRQHRETLALFRARQDAGFGDAAASGAKATVP